MPTTLLRTIDGKLVHTYMEQGAFRFRDELQISDFARYANVRLVYAVRTSLSARHLSAPSNIEFIQVFPPARPVAAVSAEVTKSAIVLSWPAPLETVTGSPVPILAAYRVYRAEIAPDSVAVATVHPDESKAIAPFLLLGSTRDAHYSDSTFEFGHTYFYTVRSVVEYPRGLVESDDSPWALVRRTTRFRLSRRKVWRRSFSRQPLRARPALNCHGKLIRSLTSPDTIFIGRIRLVVQ